MSIAHIKNTSETLPKSLHPWGASVCDKNKNRDAYDMISHKNKYKDITSNNFTLKHTWSLSK